ncbi:MAG: hypothetical protein V2A73_12350 [Pseudomonadota bacterium]
MVQPLLAGLNQQQRQQCDTMTAPVPGQYPPVPASTRSGRARIRLAECPLSTREWAAAPQRSLPACACRLLPGTPIASETSELASSNRISGPLRNRRLGGPSRTSGGSMVGGLGGAVCTGVSPAVKATTWLAPSSRLARHAILRRRPTVTELREPFRTRTGRERTELHAGEAIRSTGHGGRNPFDIAPPD